MYSLCRAVMVGSVLIGGHALAVDLDHGGAAPVRLGDFNGYLIRLSSPSSTDAVRTMTASVLGDGWAAVPSGIRLEYRLVPLTHVSAGADSAPERAWETVHSLRRLAGIQRAEPLFDQLSLVQQDPSLFSGECKVRARPGQDIERSPAWPGSWEASQDHEALRDPAWSLGIQGANVVEAWKLLGARGKEGAGVAIGHPDTGYLDHPSIEPALLGRGFDFFGYRSDAIDRSEEGRLQWPGHGTRTGSVMVGKRDFSLYPDEATSRSISGVAPAAKLMPLRVANRVVLLDRITHDMGNLALAIHAAAIGDPNFVSRRADIISMSLGGAPSRSVLDALRVAKAHNVIVLAAAGNRVPGRVVVYPARYEEVIAVAASNSHSEPWEGTSGGSTVVISAPGENVWVATRKRHGDNDYDCVEMATGTSYAVATTAGVAALWLSHRGDTLAAVRDRAQAFSALVKATARQVDGWDADEHGPGILDARALLDRWPPPVTGDGEGLTPCDDLVALSALFPTAGAISAHDLLFGRLVHRRYGCNYVGHLGDELAFVFVTDAIAAAALEVFRQRHAEPRALAALRGVVLTRTLSPSLRARLLAAPGDVDLYPLS